MRENEKSVKSMSMLLMSVLLITGPGLIVISFLLAYFTNSFPPEYAFLFLGGILILFTSRMVNEVEFRRNSFYLSHMGLVRASFAVVVIMLLFTCSAFLFNLEGLFFAGALAFSVTAPFLLMLWRELSRVLAKRQQEE